VGSEAVESCCVYSRWSCTLNGLTFNPCSSIFNVNQRRRLNLERPQEFIGTLDEFDAAGTQSYHVVVFPFCVAGRGITVSGNYTWSHCIGDNADTNGIGPAVAQATWIPTTGILIGAIADSDRRHILIWQRSPKHRNSPTLGCARHLAVGARGIYRNPPERSSQ